MTGSCRVLLVGCGQLGSRHLQAVATLPQVREIEVIDPKPEAIALGRERLAEVADRQPSLSVRWLQSLEEARNGGELCIMATQAEGRGRLVQQVAAQLGYQRFLVEKIVTQSVREYQELQAFCAQTGVSVWVNCKQRAEPIHKWMKTQLTQEDKPLTVSSVGGNHGLATGGIHLADLFAFLDGSSQIFSAGSAIDPVLHPSKRGSHLFDLSGTLLGYSETGSRFVLSYLPHGGAEHLSVVTPRQKWIVDRQSRWVFESRADTDWTWRPVPFTGNLLVSHMTRDLASNILASGRCELPSLDECFAAHRFILTELQPHFNKLLGRDSDRCPVT